MSYSKIKEEKKKNLKKKNKKMLLYTSIKKIEIFLKFNIIKVF